MGKLVFASNLLSRVKSFWVWFTKKSPAFIVITSVTVVSIFGIGVGGTLAATGVIPNPFVTASTEVTPPAEGSDLEYPDNNFENDSLPPDELFIGNNESASGEWLSSRNPFGSGGPISYRWSTVALDIRHIGPCPLGTLTISAAPQNYGYLSTVVEGREGLGGGASWQVSPGPPGQEKCMSGMAIPVVVVKCYNFTEFWINIEGPTAQAGFYKIPIPEGVSKLNCPLGSENNDPTKFMLEEMYEKLKDYPEAVVTPPTMWGPATVEWGPFVPATPTSPVPTPETSPTQTTEPST
jgi:hypothetical protein